MKKIILIVISVIIMIIANKKEYIIVPEESIRFRVISNSNENNDIKIKESVAITMSNELSKINSLSLEDSRKEIINNIDLYKSRINDVFKSMNYNNTFDINYGLNYFPEKKHKGVKYESGYYESLIVKIGKGEGNNYWCVLFPPLCMIENSDENEEVEYKFLISEIIKSIKKQK